MTGAEKCRWCDGGTLAPGFIEELGQGSQGVARWVDGQLERGLFGGAKRMGRAKLPVEAYRCDRCGHLELFAIPS